MSSRIALAALSAIFLLPLPAAAADDLARLRQELEQTKALVQQLEARLAAVEAQAAAGPPPAQDVIPPAAAAAGSANAFNPAISVILAGSFNAYSKQPDGALIAGFAPGPEAGLPDEGFSLGESEVNLSANIDPLFYGSLTAALADNGNGTEINLEEAYIETLSLPFSAKVRAGRMFPVFGYLNEIHAHADSFVDRPLPYRAFLGADNIGDDGVQVSILLPTDLYAEVGGGAFRGAAFPASGSASSGVGTRSLFARVGGDIGVSRSWLAGLSWLRGEAADRVSGDLLFNGRTDLYAVDGKYIWSPNGNLANQSLTLQGEYLWRREAGNYDAMPYREDASGWYAQAVGKFLPRWKVGYRYSRLSPPGVPADFLGTALDSVGHNPVSHSWLLEWDNSEFSSLRLQYTRDAAGPEANDEAMLRYTISMGAHGAHKY